MKKIKISTREIDKSMCIQLGYGSAQYLLSRLTPFAYSAGVYGWNCDFYQFGRYIISTGYRPVGDIKPNYEVVRKYDVAIRKIINAPYNGFTARKATYRANKIEKLFNEFIKEVTA